MIRKSLILSDFSSWLCILSFSYYNVSEKFLHLTNKITTILFARCFIAFLWRISLPIWQNMRPNKQDGRAYRRTIHPCTA